MQFSTLTILSTLAAAVAANANYSTTASAVWVTDVVTSFVTVCPAATTLSFNGVTYTATEVGYLIPCILMYIYIYIYA